MRSVGGDFLEERSVAGTAEDLGFGQNWVACGFAVVAPVLLHLV